MSLGDDLVYYCWAKDIGKARKNTVIVLNKSCHQAKTGSILGDLFPRHLNLLSLSQDGSKKQVVRNSRGTAAANKNLTKQ
eukprot:scaffold2801_cov161-Ochromonas_danica.AAC.17